jgi:hypothetical protein
MCGSEAGGTSLAALGNLVVYEPGGNGGGDRKAFELALKGADEVVATELWTEKRKNGRNQTVVLPDRFIKVGVAHKGSGYAYEPRTGKPVFADLKSPTWPTEVHPGGEMPGSAILVGTGGGDGYGRKNADQTVFTAWHVLSPDGKFLSQANILGGKNLPRYPLMEKYLPELYAGAPLQHEVLPSQFTDSCSGPVPVGNRLYLRSTSHLYCIGPR